MTVFITVGAPGSGKSTWAVAHAAEFGNTMITCRDDLRATYNITKFGDKETEAFLTKVQRAQMEAAFLEGMDVIVADTNINKHFRNQLVKFAHEHAQDVELVVFKEPLDTLIMRDAARDRTVGPDVITKFYNDLNGQDLGDLILPCPRSLKYSHQYGNPAAIVVDIDGTVADHRGVRSPYDESKVSLDKPKHDVIGIVKALSWSYGIIFVSGRKDSCEADTRAWIRKHFGFTDGDYLLHMRKHGDDRPDYKIKADLYDQKVIPNWNIAMVFDDRDQVVRHVRARGITVAQVSPGRF